MFRGKLVLSLFCCLQKTCVHFLKDFATICRIFKVLWIIYTINHLRDFIYED